MAVKNGMSTDEGHGGPVTRKGVRLVGLKDIFLLETPVKNGPIVLVQFIEKPVLPETVENRLYIRIVANRVFIPILTDLGVLAVTLLIWGSIGPGKRKTKGEGKRIIGIYGKTAEIDIFEPMVFSHPVKGRKLEEKPFHMFTAQYRKGFVGRFRGRFDKDINLKMIVAVKSHRLNQVGMPIDKIFQPL